MHESINSEIKPIIAFYADDVNLLDDYQVYLDAVANNPHKNKDLNEYCILLYEQEEKVVIESCGVIDDIPFQNCKTFETKDGEKIKEEIYNIITVFKKHHRNILQFKNSKKYTYIRLTKEIDSWISEKKS